MADSATSPSATLSRPALEAWGRGIGEAAAAGGLRLPLVVVLRGPLGAGKSVLARAIARGAGVRVAMPSPTYNLLFSYDTGAVTIRHLDLYRLDDPDDVWELGWEELGTEDEVVLIEWPERAEDLLPPDRWEVTLALPDEGADRLRTLRTATRGDVPGPPPLPPSTAPGAA